MQGQKSYRQTYFATKANEINKYDKEWCNKTCWNYQTSKFLKLTHSAPKHPAKMI